MSEERDLEKYFRPSKESILNNRNFTYEFFDNYYGEVYSKISLPEYLFKTPEDAIVNYFSILREAANWVEGKEAGCGTIGNAKSPYPVAYNFLTDAYQEKLPYDQYLKLFENILHINLIKLIEVPVYENNTNAVQYFVEIETIEGSDKGVGYFAYYYGFVNLFKEGEAYKISNLELKGENYLCAPYHRWDYMAESVVDIKYGDWCSLVRKRYPTQQDDFVKKIYFKGTDGKDYLIVFFQLTNDNDIEIAQYVKGADNRWELIKIDPEKCLEK